MLTAMEDAHTLKLPMLLMQSGADRMVDPDAPQRWSRAAPEERVELVMWDGLYHEMFNEPEQARVLAQTTDWLERQRIAA